jgi:HlyD family secretion protein
MNRGLVIVAVAVAAIAILTGAVFTHGFGLFPPKASNALALNGNVDIRQVDLGFRVGGRIASMPIEEGAHVKAGDVLAALDLRPVNDELAAEVAQVDVATAQLEKQRNGNRPQDVAEAAAQLSERRAALVKAKADYDRRGALVMTGAVSRADFDATTSQYEAAQAQVRAAEQALSLQNAGARREDIQGAVAQRAQAIAQLGKTLTDIADSTLRAPNDGVILTRAREPGAIVQAGETVLTLTIDRPMRIRAYVDETDLSRISPNMAVLVTADGNPKVYHGVIGYIAPTAEFTPKTVQTRQLRTDLVFRLRVIVTDPDDALRQGQPVTVRVPGARAAGTS